MEEIKTNSKIELNKQFKISAMKEVIKPTVPHKHAGYFEIIFLTDGAGVHTINDTDFQVEPPVLFFMTPGQVHCWEFSKIPKGYVCIFKEEFLNENLDIKLKLFDLATKFRLKQRSIDFSEDFKLLQSEYMRAHPDIHILQSYLNIILWKITRLHVEEGATQINNNPLIVEFRKLIELHFASERSVDFYADQLHVSKRTLSNASTKEIGRSAYSLINERIVVESKHFLKHTSNPVSEISYHLNFSDPSHFVKFFKSKTNLTPSEFRSKI